MSNQNLPSCNLIHFFLFCGDGEQLFTILIMLSLNIIYDTVSIFELKK